MDMDIEKQTLRKITWRIVPFIMILYLIAYIDRVNIGFAAITMKEDLGFTASILGFGAGIFFLGYFLFEVPSNIILHKVGARIWIARVMVTWGIIAGGMAFVESSTSFYVMRFLLGVAEAGFFPGIILYLSYWFPARNRAGVIALFMAAAPIATAIGSPISAALLEMHGIMGLAGWQWMFLIEAIPAVILGVVVFFYMTDRPEKAAWLKADEREWLVKTMQAEEANKGDQQHHSILRGLANPRVLALALIYFGTSAGLYTLGIWAPQIIKELGVSSMTVGLLNAIPPIISVVAMILWSRHSDKTNERTWHVALACLTAAVGLAIAASTGSMFGLIAALTIVNVGISCSKPPLWSMPTMFLSGAAAATGIATINSIGNLGGFAGPAMIGWVKDQTGSFAGGLYFVAGLLILSTVLTLILSFTQKNKANSAELSNT
ncbi:MFS transporter [Acinetobacter sp. MYb177]|uniref:MFS transporter n=1 Tax=unclassified Acinetobacter TaxID=196816 RepID=UPI0030A9DBFD